MNVRQQHFLRFKTDVLGLLMFYFLVAFELWRPKKQSLVFLLDVNEFLKLYYLWLYFSLLTTSKNYVYVVWTQTLKFSKMSRIPPLIGSLIGFLSFTSYVFLLKHFSRRKSDTKNAKAICCFTQTKQIASYLVFPIDAHIVLYVLIASHPPAF